MPSKRKPRVSRAEFDHLRGVVVRCVTETAAAQQALVELGDKTGHDLRARLAEIRARFEAYHASTPALGKPSGV